MLMFRPYLYFFPKKAFYLDYRACFLYNYIVKVSRSAGGMGHTGFGGQQLFRRARRQRKFPQKRGFYYTN